MILCIGLVHKQYFMSPLPTSETKPTPLCTGVPSELVTQCVPHASICIIYISHLHIPQIHMPFDIMGISATQFNAKSTHLNIIGLNSNRYLHICFKLSVKMLYVNFPQALVLRASMGQISTLKIGPPIRDNWSIPGSFLSPGVSQSLAFYVLNSQLCAAPETPRRLLPTHLVPLLWGHFILWSISSVLSCSCIISTLP